MKVELSNEACIVNVLGFLVLCRQTHSGAILVSFQLRAMDLHVSLFGHTA